MSDQNDQIPPEFEKLGLTSNREVPLSLFVFIVRDGANTISIPQNVSMIAAYTAEEAVNTLRHQFQPGQIFTFDLKGITPMKDVLALFQKTINTGDPATAKPEPEIIARTKKDFYKEIVDGMIKDAAAFVNDDVQKDILLVALHKMLSLVA